MIPDVVEINLRLVARGELTDDAVVKHRDARKRTLETFQALKLENLKLEEKDLTLRPGNAQEMMQMMMWNGMPSSQNKRTQIEVASLLRARLVECQQSSDRRTDVDHREADRRRSRFGRRLGMGLSDSDMMMMRRWYGNYQQQSQSGQVCRDEPGRDSREGAYELAVADARKRAERLARLNGVKLGVGRGD